MGRSYEVTPEGLFQRDGGRRSLVCDKAPEVVSYSSIDDVLYISFPSDNSHREMAAVPRRVVRERPQELGDRMREAGIRVRSGMEEPMSEFLQQQAQRVLPPER